MARTASATLQPRSPDAPTIMLVEANALKRLAIAAYLRECGYEVVETDGPA